MSWSLHKMKDLPSVNSNLIVRVTHIETPTLFYCRWESDHQFYMQKLAILIAEHTEHDLNNFDAESLKKLPDLSKSNGRLLVYSALQNEWCRARLLSVKLNNDKPACIKVWLLDFGSTEFISWKPDSVKVSKPEIDQFNNGLGLCFPCCLYNIKPNQESNLIEWTSYANYMFKKEANNLLKRFKMKIVSTTESMNNQLIVCDLMPIEEYRVTSEYNSPSLCQYLVQSNVAQYIDPPR